MALLLALSLSVWWWVSHVGCRHVWSKGGGRQRAANYPFLGRTKTGQNAASVFADPFAALCFALCRALCFPCRLHIVYSSIPSHIWTHTYYSESMPQTCIQQANSLSSIIPSPRPLYDSLVMWIGCVSPTASEVDYTSTV